MNWSTMQILWCLFAATILWPGTTHAQRDLKNIPIPDANLESQTFKLPEGFEVNLFAADPKIAKPIQMNFDPSGKLWIVSSEVYPHIEPGAEARDRVIVLEDKDHDGTSDETHVFATGLLIPTGIAPGDGGVYVANSTELLHLADDDGDLKADSRRVVLSGFGTEDTHHILHTLRWAHDGNLYFNQSIYIHSHIETPWGVRRLNAGGIWQFRPETLQLGVFMRGLVNTWGHHFDRYGQSFATDGAGGEGINYIVPGAYYFTAADAPRILHGLNPGSPKHCGLEIVETPMLPPDWQGSAITNDFRGHRVCRFNLTDDRSGYVSREQKEVIWSDHVAFRPIDVKLGPDGAIYIADWYNPIIQHGEVDFRDPRRDHTHGRIWRVSWKGAPKRDHLDISSLKNEELLALLSEDDNFRRQMARQVIRERADLVIEDTKNWQQSIPDTDDAELTKLEALWVHQSLRQKDYALLRELLEANDPGVRAAAVRVLSQWRGGMADYGLKEFQTAINDSHPRVRLEAVRGISFAANPEIDVAKTHDSAISPIEIAMQATDHATDRFLDYAIWLTSRELSSGWMPKFRDGDVDFDNKIQHILAAFSAVGEGAPIDVLLPKLYLDSTDASQRIQVANLITSTGNPDQISRMVESAIAHQDHSLLRTALSATRGRRNLQVPLPVEAADAGLQSDILELRHATMQTLGQWRLPNGISQLESLLASSALPAGDRKAAATGIALGDAKIASPILRKAAISRDTPVDLRIHCASLLTGINPPAGARVAANLMAALGAEDQPERLIPGFMLVKNGDSLLASSLKDTKINTNVAREMLRIVRESGRLTPELEATLKASGNITSRKSLSTAERAALLTMSQQAVTAAQGELVFRNPKLGCMKCHAIGGAGGKVGPDMISLGGSAQPDYLLESLLDPNAKVKENYHTIVVATIEGKLLSGVQVKQSKEEVVLRTANDNLVTIARSDIDEIAQGVSLMPEGQVDALTDHEIAALVRFLSELGRTPEYTISRRQLARTWDILQPTQEAAFRLRRTSYATAASDDPAFSWTRTYSTVAGSLPAVEVPTVFVKNRASAGNRGVGFVRTYLTAETPGTVRLKVNDTAGLELRLNDTPVDLANQFDLSLPTGTHRLTFTVDQSQRTAPLELEISEAETTAVSKFVN